MTVPPRERFLARVLGISTDRRRSHRYIVSLLLTVPAFFISIHVPDIGTVPFVSICTATVFLAALYGGFGPGVTSTFVTVFLNVYFITEPTHALWIRDMDDRIRITAFTVTGLLISALVGELRQVLRRYYDEREKLQTTLRSIGDAVIATNLQRRIFLFNEAAQALTGWEQSKALNQNVAEVLQVLDEKTREPLPNPVDTVFETRTPTSQINEGFLNQRQGNKVLIEYAAAPMRDSIGNVNGAIVVMRDASQRRQFQTELVRTEKLASVGRMAATIAHEINNPLEAVTNLIYLLSLDPSLSISARQLCEVADEELARVAEMTRQTLGFYRESTLPSLCRLSELVENVLKFYQRRFDSKSVQVETTFRDPGEIHAVSGELRQVIVNLVGNSLDALPVGGRLALRVAQLNGIGPGGGLVRLTVADSGSGIPEEYMKRIFEPFFTTKNQFGTGLGLWVASDIIRRHGGSIRVRSRSGMGTAFCIFLPRTAQQRRTPMAVSA